MNGARGPEAGQFGSAGGDANQAGVNPFGVSAPLCRGQAAFGDEASELPAQSGGRPVRVGVGKAVENDGIDLQGDGGLRRYGGRTGRGRCAADLWCDGFHVQPEVSAVERVFSSLANSV